MTELDTLLNLEEKEKTIKLTKNQKTIINYLLNLRGKRLIIEEMAKKTGLSKVTIYDNLEKLQTGGIIQSSWRIDPFVLGFKVVEVDASIDRSKRSAVIKKLSNHPAISKISKCFNNNLRLDIIVQHIDDYKEIEKHLEKMGFKIISFKVIVERLYEP